MLFFSFKTQCILLLKGNAVIHILLTSAKKRCFRQKRRYFRQAPLRRYDRCFNKGRQSEVKNGSATILL